VNETTTATEAVWTLAGIAGVWFAWLLWRRTARQVRVAEAWREEAMATPERADAEAALLVSRDRRERNLGLVVVQCIFLVVGVGAAMQITPTEAFRVFSQLSFVAAQVILVVTAWRSVQAGDRAMRLLRRARP
jgi:hypothetical protein